MEFCRSLFDTQLRRIGLTLAALNRQEKDTIINKLGGHPVAITLAADAVYELGGKETVLSITQQKGIFLTFLQNLVRSLNLRDEENVILKVFCLARDGIPREIVASVSTVSANMIIRTLLALGVLESAQYGMLRISGVIRVYFDPTELPPEHVIAFHRAAAKTFGELSRSHDDDLTLAIEAEYHAGLGGITSPINTRLIDGAVGTARQLYDEQKYEQAGQIVYSLLQGRRQLDVLRMAALIAARRNRLDEALVYAEEVFSRNRRDTWLLAELAKVALTQSQEVIAEKVVSIARSAKVEDETMLIVEGRMNLRRCEFDKAEIVFSRAKQLTKRNPWPFFYLGRLYVQLGRLDDAVDVLFEGDIFCHETSSRSRRARAAIRTQLGLTYLFMEEVDLAEPIIKSLIQEDPNSPEVIRAYAALTIKKEGIEEAHKAIRQLEKAEIRGTRDRCQYHLFCGMFYLGIGDKEAAGREFKNAHTADRQNVFVMIKRARTIFDIAEDLWADGHVNYKEYVDDCANLVRQILRFDRDNKEGKELMEMLYATFEKEV